MERVFQALMIVDFYGTAPRDNGCMDKLRGRVNFKMGKVMHI